MGITEDSQTITSRETAPAKEPGELDLKCKIAFANKIPFVFATKECFEIVLAGSEYTKPYFTMRGVTVIQEGKLEEAEHDFNLTANQFNNL